MKTPPNSPSRPRLRPPLRSAVALAALLAGAAGTAGAADPKRGEALAFEYHCMTCHGPRGRSSDGRYPHLAGQHAAYLEIRLNYFRSAVEPTNQMNAQAVHLEDDEIAALAAYFASQP